MPTNRDLQKAGSWPIESVKKILDGIIEWVRVVLLTVMTILVTFQIVVRYFFDSPNVYTESPSKYMFVWMVTYGSARVPGLREHMNIGFVRDHMPSKTRVVVEMLDELMVALFVADAVIFGDYKQTISQMIQTDVAPQVPVGIIYPAVPVSICFILFYLIYNGMKLIKKLREIQEQGK